MRTRTSVRGPHRPAGGGAEIDTFPRVRSEASAVSDHVVVGVSTTANDASHAFAYDLAAANPKMVDLGTLGGSCSAATAISGHVVVGNAWNADEFTHAFAYDLAGAHPHMIDLGALGSFSTATAVDGQIVTGSTDTSTTGKGPVHAFSYDLAAASPRMRDLGTLGTGRSRGLRQSRATSSSGPPS